MLQTPRLPIPLAQAHPRPSHAPHSTRRRFPPIATPLFGGKWVICPLFAFILITLVYANSDGGASKGKIQAVPIAVADKPLHLALHAKENTRTLRLCAPTQPNKAIMMKYRWIQKAQIIKKSLRAVTFKASYLLSKEMVKSSCLAYEIQAQIKSGRQHKCCPHNIYANECKKRNWNIKNNYVKITVFIFPRACPPASPVFACVILRLSEQTA